MHQSAGRRGAQFVRKAVDIYKHFHACLSHSGDQFKLIFHVLYRDLLLAQEDYA
jgi:hypothetical protein